MNIRHLLVALCRALRRLSGDVWLASRLHLRFGEQRSRRPYFRFLNRRKGSSGKAPEAVKMKKIQTFALTDRKIALERSKIALGES